METKMYARAEHVKFYSTAARPFVVDDDGKVIANDQEVEARFAGEALTQMAKKYVFDHPGISFGEALRIVRNTGSGRQLERAYGSAAQAPSRIYTEPARQPAPAPSGAVGDIHRLAQAKLASGGAANYTEAVKAVLAADADLRRRYAEETTRR